GGTYETPVDVEHEDGDWTEWQGPGGAWHDSERSRVSLVSMGALGSEDPRRFRPNIVLDGSGEDELVGSRVRLGTAELEIVKGIRRCVVVTRPQPGLPRDLDVYRAVQQRPGQTLCVGALVVASGTIGVGDGLTPVDDPC
ncbi:MAG: MOSC domain-containing protein, partial [Acidimicrobiales bacterium]|nr:MOSC domain-containing protein [Acidimicrobiales bacterium]